MAIKILPAEVSQDPIRNKRFEREAKTISNLSHPQKLLDFGLACPANSAAALATVTVAVPTKNPAVTEEGTIVGTFQYMSPER